MTNKLVLADTTVWIHFLRGAGTAVRETLAPLIVSDRLATAPVIVMELLCGAKAQKDFDQLQEDLAALRCLETTPEIWAEASRLAFTLRRKGLTVPLTDTLIATHALHHDALLLHDDRHYDMIAAVTRLKHTWLKPGPA